MPTTRTFAQLRTGVLRRTNLEDDPNALDVVDEAINDAVREVWGYKVDINPDLLVVLPPTAIATTIGTQAYDLPEDFGQLRRLDRVDGTRRYMVTEAPPLLELDLDRAGSSASPQAFVQYRVMGGGIDGSTAQLYLTPDPGAYTYELWYVQSPQVLADDDDVLDVTFGEGRYVEASAAAQLLERQERDSMALRAEQGRALESCRTMWRKRDAGRPQRIADVRTQSYASGRRRYPPP